MRCVELRGGGDVSFVLRQPGMMCQGSGRPGFKDGLYYLPWDLRWVISIDLSIHIYKVGTIMPSCENASPTVHMQCRPSINACLSFHILSLILLLPCTWVQGGTQTACLKSTTVMEMSAAEEKDPVLLWRQWWRWMIYVQGNGYISSCYILKASCKQYETFI